MSMDAGAFGNRLGIAEAYRFARGEEVVSSTGNRPTSALEDWVRRTQKTEGMTLRWRMFIALVDHGEVEVVSESLSLLI